MTASNDTAFGSLRAEQWTSQWYRALQSAEVNAGVDLRAEAGQSVFSLLLAISVAAHRGRDGLPVELRLPREPAGLDQLRRWNFQSVCELATGRSLRRLVAPVDHALFGTPAPERPAAKVASGVSAFIDELERDAFFGLTAYRLYERGALTRMIRSEWERWRHPLVARLVRPVTADIARDVARVLVHELLANVIQHPDATMAVVGTSVDSSPAGELRLVIAVWDDGDSVVDTLSKIPVDQLRATDADDWAADITDEFIVDARGWTPAATYIPANWVPPAGAQGGDLLLSALLPGISRKHVSDDFPQVDRPEPVAWESRRGFGLHALYRSAINAFGGTVSVRTSDFWLRLSAGEKAFQYRADIDRVDEPLFGNLVSVELPLTPARL
ncbi:hypothetical protein DVA67_024095 [Solirubrobacter sp. CPCC 204708]|uniref:ATP-binding protein n=1 Tax=Solirubrobacter deserti TaxID=2282478 RepID=A0ABT4RKV3_9ACTN|nr:hypothetical protein [Solirubrobacter deserti]MBE2319078.1 hypothetical protein [Solirubrobacter deserti]MDA0139157.1 hypothetical protein [Solirubrobacter deserti]